MRRVLPPGSCVPRPGPTWELAVGVPSMAFYDSAGLRRENHQDRGTEMQTVAYKYMFVGQISGQFSPVMKIPLYIYG